MENPQSWDLLTSSLAVSKFEEVCTTWAFLVLQGLVRDEDRDRHEFGTIVREVVAEGPITGPSKALRISLRLVAAGVSLPRSRHPDPSGKIAEARAKLVKDWLMIKSSTDEPMQTDRPLAGC